MARKAGPSDEDYDSAARLGLLGLTAGEDSDADSIMEQLAALHPRNNTFPAEVLLELAAEAIEESGASPAEPIQYEGMRDRYLPEYHFRGKSQQHKSHYALMAAAMIRAGVYPDLLDEAYGWGIDDMWDVRLLRPGALRPGGGRADRTIARGHRSRTRRASRHRPGGLLTAGHEGHHDVGGMAVEVLPPAVIDGGRPRIGVAGGDLDVTQGYPRVERRHDEGGPEHVGMDDPEAGPLADGADPAVCGAPVESLTVVAVQDRPLASLAEGEVDGPGHPWDQRDHGRLVALPDDAQGPMAPVEAEVLGVGGTGLAHPQAVEAEQGGQGGVVGVVALGREEEPAELAPVEATPFARVDLGPAGVLRWVRWDPAVDVGEAIEPADGRQPPIDGRGGQAPLLHGAPPQLDVGPLGLEHVETDVGAPLEEGAQVVAVGLEGSTAVAGQVRSRGHLGLGERIGVASAHQRY